MLQHHRFVSEAHESEPDVLWVGDSLIQHLGNTDIWEKSFAPLHSLNFGIGGDRTEHLLWRLQNGELSGLAPKVRKRKTLLCCFDLCHVKQQNQVDFTY